MNHNLALKIARSMGGNLSKPPFCPRLSFIALALFALTALVACAAGADTIELKTGERINGAFRQVTSAGVVIEVGGQSLTMPMDKVRAIYFSTAPAPTSVEATSLVRESMGALTALQSVTTSGVSYAQYAPRVLDAKVKVDQYIRSPKQGDERVRTAIGLAMRYYELASRAFNLAPLTPIDLKNAPDIASMIMDRSVRSAELATTLRQEPSLGDCPAIKKMLTEAEETIREAAATKRKLKSDPLEARILTGQMSPQVLWACAAEKIADAEQAIK